MPLGRGCRVLRPPERNGAARAAAWSRSRAGSLPGQPVSETEAVVEPPSLKPRREPGAAEACGGPGCASRTAPASARERGGAQPVVARSAPRTPDAVVAASQQPSGRSSRRVSASRASTSAPVAAPQLRPAEVGRSEPRREPRRSAGVPVIEEITIPDIVGDRSRESRRRCTSERARVEDRVDARVTRDVLADGRVAIPAGSRE